MIAAADPLLLIAITPLLLFPTFRPGWTAAALGLLVVMWVLRGVVCRETWPVTPFNPALLLFCITVPLAVWASASPDLTIPKLTGLILGLAAFRAISFSAPSRKGLTTVLLIFAALGMAMWALGLLGIRLPALVPLAQRLPPALVSLPGAPDQGINPNQLAGVLVLYLPFLFALIAYALRQHRVALGLVLALVALAGIGNLVLTRSRSGWIGLVVAAFALGLVLAVLQGSRQVRRAVLITSVVVVLVGVVAGGVFVAQRLEPAGAVSGETRADSALQQLSLDARIEIWSRALYAIEDFPFTGVGLGTFRRVLSLLYPLFLVPPDQEIPHAHNIFLQVGVDLGVGGLIAYVALLLVGGVTAWQVAASAAARRDIWPRAFSRLSWGSTFTGLPTHWHSARSQAWRSGSCLG